MPFVRDFSWASESVTADAGITIPMPAVETNDGLIALVMSDTGSQTVSCTGWTLDTAATNTCHLSVLRRIAGSSEPASYTFAGTVNETFNGAIISIGDVDTTTLINVINLANQAAAAKFSMQSVTTTRNNCLLLFAVANSSANEPSLIEGPVQGILGADGAAESLGIGWGFQATAGATPSTVGCSAMTSSAGVKAVIAINPPSGGATSKPAYCTDDTSKYINPMAGAAFNGDAIPNATADTLFGSTLDGETVSDASVGTQTFAGLNPFHNGTRVTGSSGTTNWYGAALDLASANDVDVAGMNVLIHTAPSNGAQAQRLLPVSTAQRGVAFGLYSSAGNWKAWNVHAANTAWGMQKDVPLIVHPSNTSGLIDSAGTLNAGAVDAFGFWLSGNGSAQTVFDFYSLWALGTTTVCGGNAANPVTSTGIVKAAADGHERRSAILLGKKLTLVLQALQLGDGGTNPIYLDLSASATEFPEQYSLASRALNYCSVDNVAGVTFYPGSSDTFNLRSAVFSSPSKFHWKWHTSGSNSATIQTDGCQVIGAGTVQLKSGLPLSGVTFSGCDAIASAGAVLDGCTFQNTTGTYALSFASVAESDDATDCVFTGNNRAIRITTAGTYTFDGHQFSGNTYDVDNASGGTVVINAAGGSNVSTYINSSGGSTTINNGVTLTVVAAVSLAGAEIRIYDLDNSPAGSLGTELSGTESAPSATYAYSGVTGNAIWIQIMLSGYEEFGQEVTMPSADGSFVALLRPDTNA